MPGIMPAGVRLVVCPHTYGARRHRAAATIEAPARMMSEEHEHVCQARLAGG